jgi:hypothetical protein
LQTPFLRLKLLVFRGELREELRDRRSRACEATAVTL